MREPRYLLFAKADRDFCEVSAPADRSLVFFVSPFLCTHMDDLFGRKRFGENEEENYEA